MSTDTLPFLSAERIRAAVPIADMLDAVERAYRDVAAGTDRSPLRTHVALGAGDLLLMPGVREDGAGFTVKLVTVVAANAARGLPTVQAVVVWFDAETGRPLALIDGATLTAMRTGAASGVATRLLARPDASVAAVLGAGAQAEWQLRAVLAARPVSRVLVFAPSAAHRDEFVRRVGADVEADVVAAASAEEAVRAADIVSCATTASEPVFDASWLRPGAHVNGVGAYRLDMIELPAEAFARAALVAVDSRPAAMAEAGDVVAAIESGAVAADGLVEIGSVSRSWAGGRPEGSITVFKSVGLAIQDVAAAELIVGRLLGEEADP